MPTSLRVQYAAHADTPAGEAGEAGIITLERLLDLHVDALALEASPAQMAATHAVLDDLLSRATHGPWPHRPCPDQHGTPSASSSSASLASLGSLTAMSPQPAYATALGGGAHAHSLPPGYRHLQQHLQQQPRLPGGSLGSGRRRLGSSSPSSGADVLAALGAAAEGARCCANQAATCPLPLTTHRP